MISRKGANTGQPSRSDEYFHRAAAKRPLFRGAVREKA
jgi:hypothetical protein